MNPCAPPMGGHKMGMASVAKAANESACFPLLLSSVICLLDLVGGFSSGNWNCSHDSLWLSLPCKVIQFSHAREWGVCGLLAPRVVQLQWQWHCSPGFFLFYRRYKCVNHNMNSILFTDCCLEKRTCPFPGVKFKANFNLLALKVKKKKKVF